MINKLWTDLSYYYILERELSISVLADSKKWEKFYRSKVLRILRKSVYFDALIENCTDEKEENKVILEELNVYANPSYVYFKGNGKITFQNGNEISITPEIPLALSSACIKEITDFEITDTKIMTVENLTSFNRIKETGTFYIFLSGYHNSAKQNFIKKIHNQNPEKEYLHFGDIDPDGFYILQNLRTKTNINFKPYKMGIARLEKDGVKRGKVQVKIMGAHKKFIYEIFSHRPYYDAFKTKNDIIKICQTKISIKL